MINDIFGAIGDSVSAFSTALGNSVNSITSMFYTTGENAGLTILGTLVLVGVGVALVYWAFRLIKGLLHRA